MLRRIGGGGITTVNDNGGGEWRDSISADVLSNDLIHAICATHKSILASTMWEHNCLE
jgi:hypothetical protein